MDTYLPMPAAISAIQDETGDKSIKTFTLALTDSSLADQFAFQPGQFIELFLPGKGEFPVGIASSPAEKGIIKVTVKRAGFFTRHLHQCRTGERVGIRGPFGKPFPWEQMSGRNIVLIGGGFAFTTLRSALHYMLAPDNRDRFGRIDVVYGATRPDLLLYRAELEEWATAERNMRITLTVDRPGSPDWKHTSGLVPDVVGQVVPAADDGAVALVSGPPVMVRFTIPVLDSLDFGHNQIFMSLENRMKCGVGLCGRCNIGAKSVCVDGPVFSLDNLQKLPDEF